MVKIANGMAPYDNDLPTANTALSTGMGRYSDMINSQQFLDGEELDEMIVQHKYMKRRILRFRHSTATLLIIGWDANCMIDCVF